MAGKLRTFAGALKTMGLAAAALLLTSASAWGALEDRDTTFSGDGIHNSSFAGDFWNGGQDLAVDSEGRILVTFGNDGGNDFADGFAGVERVLPNGQPDPTFGNNGVASYGGVSRPTGVAVDSQDRVLFAGIKPLDELGNEVAANVVRFTESGQLDNSFDSNGSRGLGPFVPAGLEVRPNGRAVLGLTPWAVDGKTGSSARAKVLQLTSSGAPDGGSFNSAGEAIIDFPFANPVRSRIDDLVIRADGKVVVLGSVDAPDRQALVVRLEPNGAPDSTFTGGNSGQSGWAFIPDEEWKAVTTDTNGRTVITGYSSAETDEALFRLRPNGRPDQNFGGDGLVATDTTAQSGENPTDVLIDSAGRILMGGVTGNPTCSFLARFTATGVLDSSFSQDGSSLDCSGFGGGVSALAMDSSGRALASGQRPGSGDAPNSTIVIRWLPNGFSPPPPDGDGDGVPDDDDACPDDAGPPSNSGCPESEPPCSPSDEICEPGPSTDSDGDGVPDSTDRCPGIRGVASNSGCPEGGVAGLNFEVHRTVVPRSLQRLATRGVLVLASCSERCLIVARASIATRIGRIRLGRGTAIAAAGQRRWVWVKPRAGARRLLLGLGGSGRIQISANGTPLD
jgi:uncharacterized delta-60 repeat protein